MDIKNLYHEDQFSDEIKKSVIFSLMEENIIKADFYIVYADELRSVEQAKWCYHCFYKIFSANPGVDMNVYADFSHFSNSDKLHWIPRKARQIYSLEGLDTRLHKVASYGLQKSPFLRVILSFILNYANLKNPNMILKNFVTKDEALNWLRK